MECVRSLRAESHLDNHGIVENIGALTLLSTMNTVLLGLPGAGKSTLVQNLLALNGNFDYISLGDISRRLPEDAPERQELNRLFELGSPTGVPDFFLAL